MRHTIQYLISRPVCLPANYQGLHTLSNPNDDVSDDSSDIIDDVNDDESEGVSVSVNVPRDRE